MGEKTRVLISLGASVAANCIPCFEHYLQKARAIGLSPAEIQEASEIGELVNKGARIAIRRNINQAISQRGACPQPKPKIGKRDKPCCA